jgi:hypothetical protein
VAANGYPPEGEEPMPSRKLKVGDFVAFIPAIRRYVPGGAFPYVPGGVFEVVKQLPGNEYRIKSANEPHERVAREGELTRA